MENPRIIFWLISCYLTLCFCLCSAFFVKSILFACKVDKEDRRSFVRNLAEGSRGISLVFMHHRDALRSGHSYQNDAHIMLTDHVEVRRHE